MKIKQLIIKFSFLIISGAAMSSTVTAQQNVNTLADTVTINSSNKLISELGITNFQAQQLSRILAVCKEKARSLNTDQSIPLNERHSMLQRIIADREQQLNNLLTPEQLKALNSLLTKNPERRLPGEKDRSERIRQIDDKIRQRVPGATLKKVETTNLR